MKTFVAVARAMFVVAIMLAGVVLVTSYLTIGSAGDAKCVAQEWLQGYRNRMPEFLGLPIFAVAVAAMVGAMALGRSKQLRDLFEVYDMVVYESTQITLGMVTAYSSLFGGLAGLVLVTSLSIMRYRAITAYCLTATALN